MSLEHQRRHSGMFMNLPTTKLQSEQIVVVDDDVAVVVAVAVDDVVRSQIPLSDEQLRDFVSHSRFFHDVKNCIFC